MLKPWQKAQILGSKSAFGGRGRLYVAHDEVFPHGLITKRMQNASDAVVSPVSENAIYVTARLSQVSRFLCDDGIQVFVMDCWPVRVRLATNGDAQCRLA